MKSKIPARPRLKLVAINAQVKKHTSHCPNNGISARLVRAKTFGNTPFRARERGTSACSRTHPFSAPSALIAAKAATALAAPAPQNLATRSASGALDRAASSAGSSKKTEVDVKR